LQLAADRQRATGVVALNDLMALGLMAGLREGGRRVPQDVSVVGIDGLFLSAMSNPLLTTVQLPVREMARVMVEQVMQLAAGVVATPCQQVFHQVQLIERESVAPPPVSRTSTAPKRARAKRVRAKP
jgi:DNA-binding LacI/PurR family transcriptional regulator